MNQVHGRSSVGQHKAQTAQAMLCEMGVHPEAWEGQVRRSWETSMETAVMTAEAAANESCLPQTVYLNADTAGWWHTNAFASILSRGAVAVTVLPSRYFT